MKDQTILIHGGTNRTEFMETSDALFPTSGFLYNSAEEADDTFAGLIQKHQYTRYSNPTTAAFEERMRLLEGAEFCISTSSGMSAVFGTLAGLLSKGDRIVAARAMFGSCYNIITQIMPRFGIEFELVDGTDLNQWEEAFKKPTNMVFIESPSNPSLQIVDIEAVSKLAKKVGAIVAIDNVFATPLGQKPLALGADIVIYSATKHIDGQGRVLGGLILGPRDLLEGKIQYFTRNTGPTLSPFNSWVLLKGLETMDVRLERQCNNAMQIAEFLDQHPKVKKTHYPFLKSHPQYELAKRILKYVGTVVSFDIDGGQVEAFAAMNKLKLFKISNNLGDLHSLSTHPATTTHRSFAKEDWQRISICAGTIRLSVGLEHIEDLKADLTQALG